MTDRQQSYTIHSRYVVAQKDEPRTHYISFGFNHNGVSTGVPAVYEAKVNSTKLFPTNLPCQDLNIASIETADCMWTFLGGSSPE